jgi:hypothetical protein
MTKKMQKGDVFTLAIMQGICSVIKTYTSPERKKTYISRHVQGLPFLKFCGNNSDKNNGLSR